jgi:hypothetical protein
MCTTTSSCLVYEFMHSSAQERENAAGKRRAGLSRGGLYHLRGRRLYLPRQTGSRFSVKARGPSLASSEASMVSKAVSLPLRMSA